MRFANVVAASAVSVLCACGGIDENVGGAPSPTPGFDSATQHELIAQGVGKYLGRFLPDKTSTDENTTLYTWTADPSAHGPICMKGGDYHVVSRDTGSDNLLIYLQGGGACWSDLCAATTAASTGIQPLGWPDGDPQNPLGSWNVVFVSYCDGSVFSGDSDVADTKNGGPDGYRHHHGLINLSVGIDVALMNFPRPKKIVLAGSSAGGYGTLIGTAVVRLAYPHTPLYVINDAGIGLTNPAHPETFQTARSEWQIDQFVPKSCTDCRQQFTPLIAWALARDPTLEVGAFSSYEDGTIGGAFLGMAGPDFKQLLLDETGKIHDAYPARFERYFILGGQHTAIFSFYDSDVGGVTIPEWTRRMITDSPTWPDILEPDAE